MLYENQYMLEELIRQRIEAFMNEAEHERLLKSVEPSKSGLQRLLPYAMALTFIMIAIVVI